IVYRTSLMILPLSAATLFPYTTLFRSVLRIVANIETPEPAKAQAFYGDLLGLDLLMDHGWIRTHGTDVKMGVQVSFASEGGSGRSEEHTSELQSRENLVCRLLLEKKKP